MTDPDVYVPHDHPDDEMDDNPPHGENSEEEMVPEDDD